MYHLCRVAVAYCGRRHGLFTMVLGLSSMSLIHDLLYATLNPSPPPPFPPECIGPGRLCLPWPSLWPSPALPLA